MKHQPWEKGYISKEDRAQELMIEAGEHLKESAQLIGESKQETFDSGDIRDLRKIVKHLKLMVE